MPRLLPAKLNRLKSAKIGERQRVFGQELHDAKLLSDEGWAAVEDKLVLPIIKDYVSCGYTLVFSYLKDNMLTIRRLSGAGYQI